MVTSCLAVCLWLIAACALPSAARAQQDTAALVKVAEARRQSLSPVTLVPGTVVSRSDAHLAGEIEGRLTRVADVGTRVPEGESVAEIEDLPLRLLNQELQAEIRRAQARVTFLDKEVERFAQLTESNLAALNQLEQARADRDVARGDLEVARARLAQNEDQQARTRILAPFDGIVVERLMTAGERVTEGASVVRLVDQEHLEVIARAPLEYFAFTAPGLQLELKARTGEALGTVRTVVAVGDEHTHQFEVRLDIPAGPFPVGTTLRVAIPTADAREVLAVPRDALVLRPEGQSLFVIDEQNLARQVSVTTGIGAGDQIEVHGELAAGDRVVIRGNERLQPGQPVRILDS